MTDRLRDMTRIVSFFCCAHKRTRTFSCYTRQTIMWWVIASSMTSLSLLVILCTHTDGHLYTPSDVPEFYTQLTTGLMVHTGSLAVEFALLAYWRFLHVIERQRSWKAEVASLACGLGLAECVCSTLLLCPFQTFPPNFHSAMQTIHFVSLILVLSVFGVAIVAGMLWCCWHAVVQECMAPEHVSRMRSSLVAPFDRLHLSWCFPLSSSAAYHTLDTTPETTHTLSVPLSPSLACDQSSQTEMLPLLIVDQSETDERLESMGRSI